MIEKIISAIELLKETLSDIRWARMGAEALRDRGVITRTSLDIDIATDAPYAVVAAKLKTKNIYAPLHREKGSRITQRRGVLLTNIAGVPVDVHFGDDSMLRDYEDIVHEKGKITKVESPFISLEDHLIRKLLRYNPADRTDISEMLETRRIDWKKFNAKIDSLKAGEKTIVKRNLERTTKKVS
ncbi:MAG: DUF6036 family nucleotidyltransferase [Candidatus Hydrothermarchaeales archaeon]